MILITGAMGFIGIHVARELAKTTDVVLGYNRTQRSPDELEMLVGAPVQTVQIDVNSPYSLARAVGKHRPEGIVHLAVPALATVPPAEESMANVSGLVNVLEAAHVGGVERVSIASSVAVYAGLRGGPFHEDLHLPVTSTSATSAMKKAEEILALHYGDRTGQDVLLLRIGIIYGPLYSTLANLAGRLTYLAVKGSLPPGRLTTWTVEQLAGGLDLCHVDDCARAIAAIHSAPSTQHRIYNVGGGQAVSAQDVVEAVSRAVPAAVLPEEVYNTGPLERPEAHMDVSRAREEFGITPQLSLEEGVRSYADWLRDHDL